VQSEGAGRGSTFFIDLPIISVHRRSRTEQPILSAHLHLPSILENCDISAARESWAAEQVALSKGIGASIEDTLPLGRVQRRDVVDEGVTVVAGVLRGLHVLVVDDSQLNRLGCRA
jgi:hypothetical protein